MLNFLIDEDPVFSKVPFLFLCIGLMGIMLTEQQVLYAQNRTTVDVTNVTVPELEERIEANVSALITAFNKAHYTGEPLAFAGELSEKSKANIQALWAHSTFFCAFTSLELQLIRFDAGYELRNVPLTLDVFDASGERIQRDGVVILDAEGRIDDLYFGLERHQYEHFFENVATETDFQRKQTIFDFLERFRTAYNRRDLPFIENVYSDDALIIIGRIVQVEKAAGGSSVSVPQIEYIRRKKSEYLDNLRHVFQANEFINITFEDILVVQHPVHESVYGVTLRQRWEASSYSDAGYLFLMIDFDDEDKPVIHVRTWQPEKEVNADEVFQLNDFWINTNG